MPNNGETVRGGTHRETRGTRTDPGLLQQDEIFPTLVTRPEKGFLSLWGKLATFSIYRGIFVILPGDEPHALCFSSQLELAAFTFRIILGKIVA